jgi:hypothetical protein
VKRQDGAESKARSDDKRKGFRSYLGKLLPDLIAFKRTAEQIADGPESEETYLDSVQVFKGVDKGGRRQLVRCEPTAGV